MSAVTNFIDNAVKASDENSKIVLEATQNHLSVQDYGKGIPEEDLKRVTEAFYMVDKSRSRVCLLYTSENGAEIEICANFLGESNAAENTKIVIRNHEGNTVATGTFKKCDNENFAYEAVLDITNPVLWNPEQPYLYQVLFLSENEVIIDLSLIHI